MCSAAVNRERRGCRRSRCTRRQVGRAAGSPTRKLTEEFHVPQASRGRHRGARDSRGLPRAGDRPERAPRRPHRVPGRAARRRRRHRRRGRPAVLGLRPAGRRQPDRLDPHRAQRLGVARRLPGRPAGRGVHLLRQQATRRDRGPLAGRRRRLHHPQPAGRAGADPERALRARRLAGVHRRRGAGGPAVGPGAEGRGRIDHPRHDGRRLRQLARRSPTAPSSTPTSRPARSPAPRSPPTPSTRAASRTARSTTSTSPPAR